MAKTNYESAMREMKALHDFFKKANDLESVSVNAIAKKYDVSRQILYHNFYKMFGEQFSENLKFETAIRPKETSTFYKKNNFISVE